MDINFSYESHNQTSYLLATFPPFAEIDSVSAADDGIK